MDLSHCRVLIVDDTKANIDVLVETLRDDYKLSIATDGERALRSVEKLYGSFQSMGSAVGAFMPPNTVPGKPSQESNTRETSSAATVSVCPPPGITSSDRSNDSLPGLNRPIQLVPRTSPEVQSTSTRST